MIHCPQCQAWVDVIDTRTLKDNTVRRKLECANGHRFLTMEAVYQPKIAPVTKPTKGE